MNVFVASDTSELFFTRKLAIDAIFESGHMPINTDVSLSVDWDGPIDEINRQLDRVFERTDAFILIFHTSLGPKHQRADIGECREQLHCLRRFVAHTRGDAGRPRELIICVKTLEDIDAHLRTSLHRSLQEQLSTVLDGTQAEDAVKRLHLRVLQTFEKRKVKGYPDFTPMKYRSAEYRQSPLSHCFYYRNWRELQDYIKFALEADGEVPATSEERTRYAFSYAAENKPGQLRIVSEYLFEFGANIEFVSMTSDPHHYAMYVAFSLEAKGDRLASQESREQFGVDIGGLFPGAMAKAIEEQWDGSKKWMIPARVGGDSRQTTRPDTFEVRLRTINAPGQLLAISRLFDDLKYNIESLSVTPTEQGHPRQTSMIFTISPWKTEYEEGQDHARTLEHLPSLDRTQIAFLEGALKQLGANNTAVDPVLDSIRERVLALNAGKEAERALLVRLAELETQLATLAGVRAFSTTIRHAWEYGGSADGPQQVAGGPWIPPIDPRDPGFHGNVGP